MITQQSRNAFVRKVTAAIKGNWLKESKSKEPEIIYSSVYIVDVICMIWIEVFVFAIKEQRR
jgi:hypothetical protein